MARNTDAKGFGVFGITFAVYTLALGASRAVASEPFSIRFTSVNVVRWRTGTSMATGTALASGFAGGGLAVVAGWLTSGPLAQGLTAIGLTLPGLLLQDSWRYAFVASGRGKSAFLNDLAWALCLLLGLAAVTRLDHPAIGLLILAWGGSGAAAAGLGCLQAHVLPKPLLIGRWCRQHADLIPRFAAEFATTSGTGSVVYFGIGLAGGLTAVAGIRAAWVLLGPLNILFFAVPLAAVPEVVRLRQKSPEKLRRAIALLGLALAAAALLWGGLILLLAPWVNLSVIGPVWVQARPVLAPLTFALAAVGVTFATMSGLRALASAKRSFTARLLGSSLVVGAGVTGAALGGAVLAAWGVAAGELVACTIWWWQLDRALGEHARSHVAAKPSAVTIDLSEPPCRP